MKGKDKEKSTDYKERSLYDDSLRLFAGGIAGCCAKTTVAPFDRTKILLQGHSDRYGEMGPLRTLKSIRSKEGFLGWYKGNGAQMVRIFPYSGIQFLAYDVYTHASIQLGVTERLGLDLDKLICGAMAGMTAVVCTYPLDVIRANLAFSTTSGARLGAIGRTAAHLFSQGGAAAFYRGLGPTLVGMGPYAGLAFFSFERFKRLALCYAPSGLNLRYEGRLTLHGRLLCGALAGLVAQTVAYPLDVARRNMQLRTASAHGAKHFLEVLVRLKRQFGVVRGLYRGLSLNYLRAFPMAAVSFAVYETLSDKFGILRQ